ncbi:OmpH family outer membrane protein [Parablastomonas sp. CN1-191]|uniref:OmpH family outer membrane protein n=1 Tax=Parablastomonas sp. CN1-191 TaxID=3400908 RepID=UPI003BF7FCC1
MTKSMKLALAAALAAPLMSVPIAAEAQAATAQSIAIADLDEAVANSNANKVALSQRQVTYKAQIDQYQARAAALQNQINTMIAKLQADSQAPNARTNQAALEQQANAVKALQASGQQELNTIVRPVALSEAYVNEQLGDKLDQAVTNAMTKNKVTILLNPQAVLARQNANVLTQAITNEINALIPNATLVPPAGWEPRQIREARAAQAQQQGQVAPAAAVPAPAAPRPATGSVPRN